MLEVAEGMAFLHSNSVLHRDLKPHNLFVSASASHGIKMGDFGLAKRYRDNTGFRNTLRCS